MNGLIKEKTYPKIILHALIWITLFGFPILFGFPETQYFSSIIRRTWLPLLLAMTIFYLNYFYLIDKLIFKHKVLLYLLVNLLILIAAAVVIETLLRSQFLTGVLPKGLSSGFKPDGHMPSGRSTGFIGFRAFPIILALGISVAIRVTERFFKLDEDRKLKEADRLRTELNLLKYQLQPHFFFNSLNNIYSLISISQDQAMETVLNLSKLMRYMLYDTKEENVTLADEVEFLEKYFHLMQIRLGKNVEFNTSLPEKRVDIRIAPLLFIPLVENAFKHGISSKLKSVINVELKIVESQLIFCVKNTNFPKNAEDKSGSGIGLVNLAQRLDLLYPDRFQLQYSVSDQYFIAELIIHLKNEQNLYY